MVSIAIGSCFLHDMQVAEQAHTSSGCLLDTRAQASELWRALRPPKSNAREEKCGCGHGLQLALAFLLSFFCSTKLSASVFGMDFVHRCHLPPFEAWL